ncbi:MAG: flagellar biosynthesis protein FliQ [Lachnospiraceae bacterium]|nr:flagellar biosynthesis protein FliQ [Lachnospiraceae bacterium]
MSVEQVVDIARRALWLIIETSAPLLLVSLIVGLIISIFQTVTSIQDQTLTFVPKILAVFIALMLCGGWIMQKCSEFFEELVKSFSNYIK